MRVMKTAAANSPVLETLFSEQQIAQRIEEMAKEISTRDLRQLLVVPILKGSFIFAADLLRALHRCGLTLEVDFMMLASYRAATVSSGQVEVLRDIQTNVKGRDVLLLDDILESGRTLAYAKDLLAARGARQVLVAAFLDKPNHRAVDIEADFRGFDCPDHFVVGYGMDMGHAYRELPYVGRVVRA